MILSFDTETTGLPLFKKPSDDPAQPHIVQLAIILAEDDGTERASVNLMVRPHGWAIPGDVAAIHGITTELATRCGVAEEHAVETWAALALGVANPHRSAPEGWTAPNLTIIAHNEAFDRRIMRIAMLRSGYTRERIEQIENMTRRACTMKMASAVMKLPPTEKMVAAGFNNPKPPNLGEATRHFFDEDLRGAHDAMVDCRAALRIYLHLSKDIAA